MEEVIADWWACKYFPSSAGLPSDANAIIIIFQALCGDSHDLWRAEEHPRWISINEFTARLTKGDVCDWTRNAIFLFDDLLDKLKLRDNPILFFHPLSAVAQYMVHAAFNALAFCKKHSGCQGQIYRWEKWKAVFKEAGTVENIKARNEALSTVVAMNTAEQLYSSFPMKGKLVRAPHAMSR